MEGMKGESWKMECGQASLICLL